MTFDQAATSGLPPSEALPLTHPTYSAPNAAVPILPSNANRAGFDGLAVTAFVVGFFPWFGALALVAGGFALHRMKATGSRGRILAIVGMTFGGLWAIDLVLAVASGRFGH